MDRELDVVRFNSGPDSTIGLMFLDGKFHCYTCEDEGRVVKVKGETRIPAGRYEIKLRNVDSPMNKRYSNRFPGWHAGMLWLQDVPGFSYVYIHIGNDDDDTEGCILVGYDARTDEQGGGKVLRSTLAYVDLYKILMGCLIDGDRVFINIRDKVLI